MGYSRPLLYRSALCGTFFYHLILLVISGPSYYAAKVGPDRAKWEYNHYLLYRMDKTDTNNRFKVIGSNLPLGTSTVLSLPLYLSLGTSVLSLPHNLPLGSVVLSLPLGISVPFVLLGTLLFGCSCSHLRKVCWSEEWSCWGVDTMEEISNQWLRSIGRPEASNTRAPS